MANNITNILKASALVLSALKGAESLVDFNKVIPMPESLKKIQVNGDECLVLLLNGNIDLNPPASRGVGDIIKRLELSNVISLIQRGGISKFSDERFENFMAMVRNLRNHGSANWYDFGCDKWGTKWNAYEAEMLGDDLTFETAWDAPHPVIKALAKMFPDERIDHHWASEDIGSNLGVRIYEKGLTFDAGIEDKIDFALTLTGSDRDYYRKNEETGLWEYFDKDESE